MRHLVICADGTWKAENSDPDGVGNTNVVKLKNGVAPTTADGTPQLVFYDPGVGVGSWWERLTGGAFGHGLSQNVVDCYTWLVDHSQPGDRLFLFGFSRGAYTIRSLAGLVRNCGILHPEQRHRIGEAYKLYRKRGAGYHPASERAREFRSSYSRETSIRCIGVLDTVGSLGIPTRGPLGLLSRRRHGFHDVQLSSQVENGFHALAIDERRGAFAPTLWEVRERDLEKSASSQRIQQCWFAGVHSNVGGGYPDCGLSDLTLQWMLDRAESCGLEFTPECRDSLRGACTGAVYDSLTLGFRLLGVRERSIDVPRWDRRSRERVFTFEDVDRSALERFKSVLNPPYAPRNFLDYWKRNPEKWSPDRCPVGSGAERRG